LWGDNRNSVSYMDMSDPSSNLFDAILETSKKKLQAWTKFPDASYLFEDPELPETIPTVIALAQVCC